jgi:molybdenum cofactor sulfurtransferase
MFKIRPKSKTPISSTNAVEIIHDAFFNALRANEYSRLDKTGQVYLDFTGGNLYASSQLSKHNEQLEQNVLGNPHSTNPASKKATELVHEARDKVIEFFNAEDYHCIFTQKCFWRTEDCR